MEKNTVTTVGELKIGDRFYKLNDTHKKVWQVMSLFCTKPNVFQNFRFSCMPVSVVDSQAKPEVKAHYTTEIRNSTQVVYLRNVNSQT